MELFHQLVQILVILAYIRPIDTQCLGNNNCVCHCWSCRSLVPCASCEKGWSGTTANYCQRKNIAYLSTATSTSINSYEGTRYPPQNAVDEDEGTIAITNSEENPKLTLTLPESTDIRHLYLKLIMDAYAIYKVYVTSSNSTALTTDNVCASVSYTSSARHEINRYCDGNRAIKGNQIVITRTTYGRLEVYEVRIYKCTTGTYGDYCENRCLNCQDNRCDGDTGVCELGCKSGWYGDICDKECPSQCQPSSCDRTLGCTNCLEIGYNGPNCEPCSSNTYGRNCTMTCQNCPAIKCNYITGCQQCYPGFYGTNCINECAQGCKNGNCEKDTGRCLYGCKDGYMGTTCTEPCRGNCATCTIDGQCLSCVSGKFGIQCENDCSVFCGGNKTCDRTSGDCLECSPGKYGPNCTEACSTNCLPPSVCHINGNCAKGCSDGWIGSKCDKRCQVQNCEKCSVSSNNVVCEICNYGYFLDDQKLCQKCPSNCVTCENGSKCIQCKLHWKGKQCDETCNENCIDGLCTMDGTCIYGCNNSKYGIGCTRACMDNCMHCFNGNHCTECLPGFYRPYCWECKKNCFNCTNSYICESCKAGFYGDSCSESCPKGCQKCESQNKCSSCRKGWTGDLCQCSENCALEECGDGGKCLRACKDSFYGDYCNFSCPIQDCQKCDQSSGTCTLCFKGYYGNNCTQKCSTRCLLTECDIEGACLIGSKYNFSVHMCIFFKFLK